MLALRVPRAIHFLVTATIRPVLGVASVLLLFITEYVTEAASRSYTVAHKTLPARAPHTMRPAHRRYNRAWAECI